MWSEHFTINLVGLSFHFMEVMAQRKAVIWSQYTWQGVRKWQQHASGSRNLQEVLLAWWGCTKQPTEEIWIPQYCVHCLTRPRRCITFHLSRKKTLNPHMCKQKWTIISMNIKTFSCPSESMTEGNTQEQLFGNFCHQETYSPKRRQNMLLQSCVSCSMMLSCIQSKTFDPGVVRNCQHKSTVWELTYRGINIPVIKPSMDFLYPTNSHILNVQKNLTFPRDSSVLGSPWLSSSISMLCLQIGDSRAAT